MPDFKHIGRDIANQARLVQKLATGDLQRIIGVEGKNHFEASWDNQGFTDQGLKKWDSRTEPVKKFKKKGGQLKSYTRWKAKNARRAILVSHRTDTKGGHLKDTIGYRVVGTKVIFYTDKPYAQVHNEGGKAGRGMGFIMKQRQFMGRSHKLDMNIKAKLDREMDKIFK